MISYEIYCKIRAFHQERKLTFKQIAGELDLNPETVAKYARVETFQKRTGARRTKRASKLDAFKAMITRWLDRHPYSAMQIFQRLGAEGYTGGLSIVRLRALRAPGASPCVPEPGLRAWRSRAGGLGLRRA